MNEEKKLVPRLRFPEFREAEGWEIKPLKKLFSKWQRLQAPLHR